MPPLRARPSPRRLRAAALPEPGKEGRGRRLRRAKRAHKRSGGPSEKDPPDLTRDLGEEAVESGPGFAGLGVSISFTPQRMQGPCQPHGRGAIERRKPSVPAAGSLAAAPKKTLRDPETPAAKHPRKRQETLAESPSKVAETPVTWGVSTASVRGLGGAAGAFPRDRWPRASAAEAARRPRPRASDGKAAPSLSPECAKMTTVFLSLPYPHGGRKPI